MTRPAALLALIASLALALAAHAQNLSGATAGSKVIVKLDSGETLIGTVAAQTADTLIITHAFAGDVPIPIQSIRDITITTPAPEQPEPEAQPEQPDQQAEPAVPDEPASFFTGWKGSAELGLSGSSGVTETTNFRAGANAKRETDLTASSLRFTYTYASEESNTTTSKSKLSLQHDWRTHKDDRHSYFVRAIGEYDQFQSWRWRTSAFAGLGYRFIDNETTTFITRVGLGATKEFGSSQNEIMPEALLAGFEFAHQINDEQRFTATLDIYPALDRLGPYRADATAAYEVLLSEDNGLTLKLGVEDSYDSTPGEGVSRNDFTYFAVLVWDF